MSNITANQGAPGFPIASKLYTLCNYIVEQLTVNTNTFDAVACWVGFNPSKLDAEVADNFCVITPGRQNVWQPSTTGGGSTFTYFRDGEVFVTVWARSDLDAARRADVWFGDPLLGIMTLAHVVIDQLHMYQPIAGNSTTALTPLGEPLRLASIGQAERYIPQPQWGSIEMKFYMNWQLLIP